MQISAIIDYVSEICPFRLNNIKSQSELLINIFYFLINSKWGPQKFLSDGRLRTNLNSSGNSNNFEANKS